MKTRKEWRKELLPYEKKFDTVAFVLACITLFSVAIWGLDKVGVLTLPFDFHTIALATGVLTCACGAVTMWRIRRSSAICSIVVAVAGAIKATYEIVQLFR